MTQILKSYSLYIKDVLWTFRVLTHEEYKKTHGDDSQAITQYEHKRVDFDADKLVLSLVRHELLHVYVDSCMLYSTTSISSEDKEEIIAEILEYHMNDYLKYGKEIYKKIKGRKK